jgi:hypothetical protein
LAASQAPIGDVALAIYGKRSAGLLRQIVQHFKSNIMARVLIFGTRVTQSNDKKALHEKVD